MKAIKLAEPWKVSCVDIEKPVPKPGEALIKVVTAGICGSDIGAFRGTNGLVSYPRVIGHELAGIVESIPENNKNGIKVGDRVVVDPYLYCGHCYPCRIGRTNCCTDLKVLGVHVDGGMAEYYCHPADMLIKIPEGMSWEQAAMAEPLTISLHGIHRGGLQAGEYCAIIGAGLILYLNAFGFEKTERFFTARTYKITSFTALACYALCKSYSFYTGANHIESVIPLGTPGAILSSGLIFVLNICVGVVVAGTMYTFYVMFRKGGY